MRVVRLGDNHPGEEGPERERYPHQAREVGRTEGGQRDSHHEKLSASGADDTLQKPRKNKPRGHEKKSENGEGLDERQQEASRGNHSGRAQYGNKEHHGNYGEVLEEKDADPETSLERVHLATLLKQLENDGGRAERDQETQKNGFRRAESPPKGEACRKEDGHADLKTAPREDEGLHLDEFTQGELEADHKEKQDHTDLGHDLNGMGIANEAQPTRADQNARDEETDDSRDTQFLQKIRRTKRDREKKDQLLENGNVVH